jgi:hypothetical protein
MMDESPEYVALVVAELTSAQRRAAQLLSPTPMTAPEAGISPTTCAALARYRPAIARRVFAEWGADPQNGRKRGCGYEYWLTPLGILVRQHLEGNAQ